MFRYLYCVLVLVSWLLAGVESQSQCSKAAACETDMTDADCLPGQVVVPYAGIFGCCPGCQVRSEEIVNQTATCRPPSNCLADGRFAPVQCKGDMFTGRCFCSDGNGKRIFGQMWRREASEMTCACSRRRVELEATGRMASIHCTRSGDYEDLQCDDGICWCVEPKTGQPTVPPMQQADMKHLPCYSANLVGEQYLRKCESLVQAMATISEEQSAHGTNFLGSASTYCDYDGSYGPYQIQNGVAYCTGRDGAILGSWQTISSEMTGMNCNCARDTALHFPENGMTATETCQANGNYRPNQNVGDVYYCVDLDGYPATEMLEEWPTDNCASFS